VQNGFSGADVSDVFVDFHKGNLSWIVLQG
jgi:hypothetical protein